MLAQLIDMLLVRTQFRLIIVAIQFYSRITINKNIRPTPKELNKAVRYFPLIGLFISLPMVSVFWLSSLLISEVPALILMFAAGILTTGGFHEDGFIDFCDGFGGGYTKNQILTIMKDSRVGSYGAIGIVLLLSLKVTLLWEIVTTLKATFIESNYLFLFTTMILTIQMISRLWASTYIISHQYVSINTKSKNKFVANKIQTRDLIFSSIYTIGILLWLNSSEPLLSLILIAPVPFWFYLGHRFRKHIGGYTGDCLGAAQQVFEIALYLGYLVLCNYI